MPTTIQFKLPDLSNNTKTAINSNTTVVSGSTSLPVYESQGININDHYVAGVLGNSNAECLLVNGAVVSQVLLPVSALKYNHGSDEPVVFTLYDSWYVYRSTSGVNGVFSNIGIVAVQWNQLNTTFIDPSGSSTYYYYGVPVNTYTGAVGPQTVTISGSGYPWGTRFKVKQIVRNRLKDTGPNPQYTDSELNDYCDLIYADFQMVMNDLGIGYRVATPYVIPFSATQLNNIYSLPSNFDSVAIVQTSNDITPSSSSSYYICFPEDTVQGIKDRSSVTALTYPPPAGSGLPSNYFFVQNGANMGIGFNNPIPTTGSATIWFYPTVTQFQSDLDTIISPLGNFTRQFIDGVYMECMKKQAMGSLELVQLYNGEWQSTLQNVREYLQRIQKQETAKLKSDTTAKDMANLGDYYDAMVALPY